MLGARRGDEGRWGLVVLFPLLLLVLSPLVAGLYTRKSPVNVLTDASFKALAKVSASSSSPPTSPRHGWSWSPPPPPSRTSFLSHTKHARIFFPRTSYPRTSRSSPLLLAPPSPPASYPPLPLVSSPPTPPHPLS